MDAQSERGHLHGALERVLHEPHGLFAMVCASS
jgi:hypothetical protein